MVQKTKKQSVMETTFMDEDDDGSSTNEEEPTDTAGSTSGRGGGGGESSNSSTEIARQETLAVLGLRFFVVLLLVLVAIAVTLLIWFTTTNAEEEDFETNYEGAGNKLLESFEEIVGQKLGAIAGLGVTFTSYARSVNATWPFVTLNDFQQRAASARRLSDTLFMEFLPLVTGETRLEWEKYSVANKGWLDEGRAYQRKIGLDLFASEAVDVDQEEDQTRKLEDSSSSSAGESYVGENVLNFVGEGEAILDSPIADKIWRFDENWAMTPDPTEGPYFPIWESSPIIVAPRELANYNLLDFGPYGKYVTQCVKTKEVLFGGALLAPPGNITSPDLTASFFAFILSYAAGKPTDYVGDPFSSFYVPVFDSFDDKEKRLVGVLVGVLQWANYFDGVLPSNAPPLAVVLENSCDGNFTYIVSADSTDYVGEGDLHDPKFSHMELTASFQNLLQDGDNDVNLGFTLNEDLCSYQLHVYPTQEFHDEYVTSLPVAITLSVTAVFCCAILTFFCYNQLVEYRQNIVMTSAKQTTAIVASLFPAQIKDRLLAASPGTTGASSTKKFRTDSIVDAATGGKPLADLFLETSVCFADVQGFTAWSSAREPSQVFTLLEMIYQAFDKVATRRRVFKVETVGDCYVACSGLPEQRKDHAVAICRFAADILAKMHTLTREIEVILGPGELGLRIGIHSGPVTAGVLRGERARFQLFGDTVNTTSKIESTGKSGRIHCSAETADLLRIAGKEAWLQQRTDIVNVKGKGLLGTYWVNVKQDGQRRGSDADLSSDADNSRTFGNLSSLPAAPGETEKRSRLIDWNVEMLLSLLKEVIAERESRKTEANRQSSHSSKVAPPEAARMPLDEVSEIVTLPDFRQHRSNRKNPEKIVVPAHVIAQLRDLVASISKLYRENAFHNFEHASHVMMAVIKTLSRIVAPSTLTANDLGKDNRKLGEMLHDHTYGITSDPLIQFACAFSALIHDVDHSGVSNAQLVKEGDPLCATYRDRSVAEQNSLDLSWEILMEDRFAGFRELLIPSREEQHLFRQLVVNSVMATDIADKDLKALRNGRWDKAFKKGDAVDFEDQNPRDAVNRKATIVIEHIIQASDISHTMQHWHQYRKWNTKLFEELYVAYLNGRMDKSPAEFWYKGEIGFFDFYIIPLTQKLKECGVFGVTSGEFLSYATSNRAEWVEKGEAVTAELVQMVQEKYHGGNAVRTSMAPPPPPVAPPQERAPALIEEHDLLLNLDPNSEVVWT